MSPDMQRVTDYLLADHGRLQALLATAARGPDVDLEAFAEFRAGLLRHIAIEEKVLFPAVRRARGGAGIARARDLRVDHAALTSLLVPSPSVVTCHEIALILCSHDAMEEGPDGVYEECEAELGPALSAELAARAGTFALPPLAPHFDGPGVYRTASAALEAARSMKAPRGSRVP